MTAIRSTKTARTEDMTAKSAFRGCRAIAMTAAAIAYGLLAAPLQADHETFDVTVTLTVTVGDGRADLQASHTGGDSDVGTAVSGEIIGCVFQAKRADVDWDNDWWNMNDCEWPVEDLDNGIAYSFRSKAYRATRGSDGEYHFAYSEPSDAVTATPEASTE